MASQRVISADSHVNEPEAAWERIPKKLREKGPHYVQNPNGKKGLYLVIEGHRPDPIGQTFLAGTGRDPAVVKDRVENFTWDRWRGPWDASARAADMDLDGVWLEVLYPSLARNLYGLSGQETPLQLAGLQSYNDWMQEYCAVLPNRLIGLGLLSVLDIPWSVNEMKRCAKIGLKGVVLPAVLPKERTYADPDFEPIWKLSEEMDFPVHFHVNIKQSNDRLSYERGEQSMLQTGYRIVNRNVMEAPKLMTELLFGLVLEKHPKMRVVFAEYELHWVLPFMTRFEGEVARYTRENPGVPTLTALPSEIIKRQVYITFQDDAPGVAGADAAGLLDNAMWASDYPHGGATWPNSPKIIDAQLKRIPAQERKKLLWDNAAKFYGLN
jgi:predicted TIM-barrel fold metal-dependent hydrolase